jgi:CubicO group peptidase (beta-lactamase class C family)
LFAILRLSSQTRIRRPGFVLGIVLLLSLLVPAFAQKLKPPNPLAPKPQVAPQAEAPRPMSTPVPELTAADLETFLDGIMPLQLAREDIAGATIAVVKDGKLFFAKGYGFADVSKRVPISPDGTLFRPGSISKLFTWTAVMQLVEQGKLDLDRDVNDYLDFKIPPTFSKPITLRDIMTHTPGFEEVIKELIVGDAKDLTPLGQYVKTNLPQRIYPPWTTPAYSNYATTVAGYIVQRVSGESFETYIEQHILKPLGMNSTTFRQPLPDALKDRMSKGYNVASHDPGQFELVEAAPAGACSTTATDMARFMIAHLQDGQFEGAQILQPDTARRMHSRQFANLPDMNAMALGFYEETRNGHRIIGHAGDTDYFHSDLHLIPDANLGFFISYNSGGKGEISTRTAVWHQILDRYFPFTPAPAENVKSAAQDAQTVAGRYLVSRRSETTIMKVLTSIGQSKVFVNDDGTISVSDEKDLNGAPKRYKEIAPLMFRDPNGQDRIAFRRDTDGSLTLITDFPAFVFQRVTALQNSAFNLSLLIGCLSVMALALLIWPISALTRRHYGRKSGLEPREHRLWVLVRIVCALNILFVAGYTIFFTMAEKDISVVSPSHDPWLRLIQFVGWLGCLGALVALYNAVRAWKTPNRWIWSKLVETAICLACLGLVWFVYYWNMLHWSLKY